MADKTFTYTTSVSNLRYGFYGSSWSSNTGAAYQGNYAASGTENTAQRVGFILFSGAGDTLKNAVISKITLKFTYSSAGGGTTTTKTIKFHKSAYQSFSTSYTPKSYLDNGGGQLGSISTIAYGNTSTYTLDASNNSGLFNAMASYLSAGNSAILIYNADGASTSSYSANYLSITSATITVTYTDGGLVYIDNGSGWDAYQVYIDNGSSWDLYIPYIDNGSSWDLYS